MHQPVIGQQMPTVPIVTFADAFASGPPLIVTMLEIERARKLCPSKLVSCVVRISDSKVLMFGVNVHLGEANSMHLLFREAPTVHVPHVYNAYKIGEVGYILMEYILGATLGKCWARLLEVEKSR